MNGEMKNNQKKFTYSKIIVLITGLIFIACISFSAYLYISEKITSVYDATALVTMITVSGSIFGSNLCWYSKKAASENQYKFRMSLFSDSAKVRLDYNEKMMQLMKKYGLTENDINKIDESGDIDEMMNSALNNVIDELDTQQNDSDSPNEMQNFG